MSEVVANSDFRKFDDALRMVVDCSPGMAQKIEDTLAAAETEGHIRYGCHREDAAIMTCFTPSPSQPSHVHFIDGAQGGYAWRRPRSSSGFSCCGCGRRNIPVNSLAFATRL